MKVSLIMTPEVGVHYANSGLPKDLFSKPENVGRHADGGAVTVNLAPNAFALPSLSAPEFTKRYHNFLTRIDSLLADLGRTQPQLLENVTAILTGSFWKYYRSPKSSCHRAFGGTAGDFSGCAGVTYRQGVDQYFAQREFADPTPAASNRWKVRAYEDLNRRWFYQQSEDVFRTRSTQFVRRKALSMQVKQVELFTPEADPGFSYSNFLQMMSGANADFNRLSVLVDEAATRASSVVDTPSPPFIHWTGFGGFRTLSDSEKQFLILKSLLLMGGQNGGIMIDDSEWFSLSESFRARVDSMARQIAHGALRLKNRALYLTPHLWSGAGTLWDEIYHRVGACARMVSSVDRVLRDRDARLLVVDPSMILNRDAILKLTGWAKGGRILVLPRSPLYTESAKFELETILAQGTRMDIGLGISYRLHMMGEGKVILYDLPQEMTAIPAESLPAWQSFIASVLSLAGIHSYCHLSDSRLRAIPLLRKDGGIGLFILNSARSPVAADLYFTSEVAVSDLAASFNRNPRATASNSVVPASRFALEVPPCGVLPLAVDGIRFESFEAQERAEAAQTSELMRNHVLQAASNELPGFAAGEDINATWS